MIFLLAAAFLVGGIVGLVIGTYTTLHEVEKRKDRHLAWLMEQQRAQR